MSSINKLRKEKEVLSKYIEKCKQYRAIIEERLLELGKQYKEGKISREEYYHKINYGLGEKSFRYYIQLYHELQEGYEQRLIKAEAEIKKRKGVIISSAIFLIAILMITLVYKSNITGHVVFSKIESREEILNLTFNGSDVFDWEPLIKGRLNTISLSGEYIGNGSLRIYLDLKNESKLIYATESASTFESVCGTACYLYDTSQEKYDIRVEMPSGNKLIISKIEYFVSELEEFRISPSNVTINLTDNRFIKNKFEIYNSRNKNFSVAIYAEGELTDYTTLYSSFEEFSENDSLKYVRYDIDVPLKIEPGTYTEKIIVRYLPKEKFTGKAPTEEHRIVVNVLPSEKEALSPKKENYWGIVLIVVSLVTILNIVVFVYLKRRR